MNKIENINLLPDTEPDSGDYTGEDGLLYCGKCRKPKEAYFPEGKTLFGLDRHPAECDCQRAQRIEREAAEQQRRHLDTVEDLKRRGFSDTAMRDWEKLPCGLYRKRPDGAENPCPHDELCRYPQ